MKIFLQIIGGFFLAYSVAGIALHALANLESFGHHCEMLLLTAGENHLQVFTIAAAIAAVIFLLAAKAKKKNHLGRTV